MRTHYSRLWIALIVVFSVTLLSYIYFLRPWHMHWGATLEERTSRIVAMSFCEPRS